MDQFNTDPSKVTLDSVCQIRYKPTDAIVLELQQISADQLKVVRRHEELFGGSSIFRQIHDKVKENWSDDADEDVDVSDADEDEDSENEDEVSIS
jgi:hypothetical protein